MRVIIAAGGSGGHIFPAIATAAELEKAGVEKIFFVASRRELDKRILRNYPYRSFFLSINPMPYGGRFVKWCVFVFKLMVDSCVSVFLLITLRPSVVAGFGGYSSGALVKCASFLGIPTVIHEQNVFPGRANRLLRSAADRVALSFRSGPEDEAETGGKFTVTGNPIRSSMFTGTKEDALGFFGLEMGKRTVLIMGGSQGASRLNDISSRAAEMLLRENGDMQFIHLTGISDYRNVQGFYDENKIPARAFSFIDRIDMAYAASDIAVTRAGAAAIFELAYYGRPMVLVPYPNKKNSQTANADMFAREGAAVLLEEKVMTSRVLADTIAGILADERCFLRMSEKAKALSRPDAGKDLASIILDMGCSSGKVNKKREG